MGVMRKGLPGWRLPLVTVVASRRSALSLPVGQRVASKVIELLRGESDAAQPVPIETADLSGSGPGTADECDDDARASRQPQREARCKRRGWYIAPPTETPARRRWCPAPSSRPWAARPRADGRSSRSAMAPPASTRSAIPPCPIRCSDSRDLVLGFVKSGYAVALPDYQGLGEDGVHPYTDAKTAGLNMIDAVRALRHTFERHLYALARIRRIAGRRRVLGGRRTSRFICAGVGSRWRRGLFTCSRRDTNRRQGTGAHADR